jgi:hypothetical protein
LFIMSYERCESCNREIAEKEWTIECKACMSDVGPCCIDGEEGRLCRECWPDFHKEPFVSELEIIERQRAQKNPQ